MYIFTFINKSKFLNSIYHLAYNLAIEFGQIMDLGCFLLFGRVLASGLCVQCLTTLSRFCNRPPDVRRKT